MATHSRILAWRILWTEEPNWWATVPDQGTPLCSYISLKIEHTYVTYTQEKEHIKAVYCHPAFLTSLQSTS